MIKIVTISASLASILLTFPLSAKAGYLYDSYHSTGPADSAKLMEVSETATADGVAMIVVKTLCRDLPAGSLTECAPRLVLPKERVVRTAAAEDAQFQRLLASFDKSKKPAPIPPSQNTAGLGMASMALGFAFPPSAPIAIPLGAAIAAVAALQSMDEESKKEKLPPENHPKLGTLDASSLLKALHKDVSVSDYQQRDVLTMIHAHVSDLFTDETQKELAIYLNPAVAQNRADKGASAAGEASAGSVTQPESFNVHSGS